jgi:hypothetical protein
MKLNVYYALLERNVIEQRQMQPKVKRDSEMSYHICLNATYFLLSRIGYVCVFIIRICGLSVKKESFLR